MDEAGPWTQNFSLPICKNCPGSSVRTGRALSHCEMTIAEVLLMVSELFGTNGMENGRV